MCVDGSPARLPTRVDRKVSPMRSNPEQRDVEPDVRVTRREEYAPPRW